jgi:2-keto-4-pentenoate hydratase/2-oxohepta-3-ene-1,7-dioic acid hydratase in catechol pathway
MKSAELIELASSFYTLYPGDIISTGTPEGVSPIAPGDTVVATVERVGTMEVKVRAFASAAVQEELQLAKGKVI